MSQIIRRRFPVLLPLVLFAALVIFTSVHAKSPRGPNSNNHRSIVTKAKRYGLVELKSAVPGVHVDLQYTVTSASGKPLYLKDMPCLVNRSTSEKLRKAQRELKKQGYALKVWDAWRPPEAHLALWDAVKDPKYVVPPSKGLSLHCYGIAVDLTIVKADGSPLKMPSKFDEFSSKAASKYAGSDQEIAANLEKLQAAMRNAGFRIIKSEWWHFDDLKAKGVRRVNAENLGIRMP
ncbi:MAG: M15 family metallopeptidase [Verrucomicrobiales bacterium]|nr:M15 family metallopeptidase [Verrucomicrobiales bacterium]